MSDTYAVVNKIKRPPTAAPLAPHHYDNEKSQSASPSDLYSIVKPKNRPATGATAIAVPVYNRAWPANHKVQMDCADYEPLPGVFQVRGSQLYPSLPQLPPNRHSVNDDDEDEDDYEYVSNPIRQSSSSRSSSSSTGGMGFKCRIRKPKGPRDPPSQWNRPER